MYILFICAGGVIHFIGDYQVICFIGGLSVYIRFTSSFMVYNFAICRVAFLVVFNSKDFKIYICIYIYIYTFNYITNAPTCFGVSAPSSARFDIAFGKVIKY